MDYQEYLSVYVSYDKILAKRCWAAILDYVIYFILIIIYGYFFGDIYEWGIKENGSFAFRVNPGFLSTVIIWILYFPGLESFLGYTIGKGAFDLKVIQEDKKDFPFIVSFKRHILDPIDFAFFGLVGILLVKFTKEHKRLGDFWAKSLIVMDEAGEE